MRSDARPSVYRQPVQARACGTMALAAGGLFLALLSSLRLMTPPTPAIDAGPMAVFVTESLPVDQPAEPQAPHPTAPPPPMPRKPAMATTSPSHAAPIPTSPAVEVASPGSPAQPASAIVLPSAPALTAKPAEGAHTAAPAAPATPMASSATAAADWRARLLGHLQRYRRYPRQAEAARQQGVARVAITLHRSGEVIAVELVHGSGYPLLDMEARTTVRRASPLPAVDAAIAGDPVTVEVPIDFALRR